MMAPTTTYRVLSEDDGFDGEVTASGEDDLPITSVGAADSFQTSSVAVTSTENSPNDEFLTSSYTSSTLYKQSTTSNVSDKMHSSNSSNNPPISIIQEEGKNSSSTVVFDLQTSTPGDLQAYVTTDSPLTTRPTTDESSTSAEFIYQDLPTFGATDNRLTKPTTPEPTVDISLMSASTDNLLTPAYAESFPLTSSGTDDFMSYSDGTLISDDEYHHVVLTTIDERSLETIISSEEEDQYLPGTSEETSPSESHFSQDILPDNKLGPTEILRSSKYTLPSDESVTNSGDGLLTSPSAAEGIESSSGGELTATQVSGNHMTMTPSTDDNTVIISSGDESFSSVASSQYHLRESERTESMRRRDFSHFQTQSTESNAFHVSTNFFSSFSASEAIHDTSTVSAFNSTAESFAFPYSIPTKYLVVFGTVSSFVFALVLVNCLFIFLLALRGKRSRNRRRRRVSRNLSTVNFRQINTQPDTAVIEEEEERTEDSVDLLTYSPEVFLPSSSTVDETILSGTSIRPAIRSGHGTNSVSRKKSVRFEPETTANGCSTATSGTGGRQEERGYELRPEVTVEGLEVPSDANCSSDVTTTTFRDESSSPSENGFPGGSYSDQRQSVLCSPRQAMTLPSESKLSALVMNYRL